jgi:RNA polymerase sigma factor (sigma-70 family)
VSTSQDNWFGEFHARMNPRLFIYFARYGRGDTERALDLTQELWMKYSKEFKDLLDQVSISEEDDTRQVQWLYTAAKRLSIDEHRKNKVRDRHAAEERGATVQGASGQLSSPPSSNPNRNFEIRTTKVCVETALSALNPDHAESLMLKDCGQSFKQIAEQLRLSHNSLGTTLHRARNRFKEVFCRACPDECLEFQGAAT